ncbi:M23 family metallopeptidase [Streptomyces sp. A7024]|uniref:M23 family metallopeptidase n=1 Tax=Streptomyces coryli TaxID=1128680 RepID=A0A6G4UCB2_9ACTN|nr:M23 family metallopeptidase [Streptomyces coryli]NGN69783.1 M23 family metallopeptidase [Streptomyces coryli]
MSKHAIFSARTFKRTAALAAGAGVIALAGSGVANAAPSWVSPIDGKYQFSAGYDQGGARWAHKHSGQDFAVSTGTKVHAVHGGTVVEAGWGGAYGNNIVVKHSNGVYSQYAHLSKFDVKLGDKVKTNEVIALSGNTGNSSGPHLHFEIRTTPNYGSAVNPVDFLKDKGVKLHG